MTEDQLDKLAVWYRSEFKRRTEAIKTSNTGTIDWLVPDYRVSRTEVVAYAESIGIVMDAQDNVQLFHYLNNRKERE